MNDTTPLPTPEATTTPTQPAKASEIFDEVLDRFANPNPEDLARAAERTKRDDQRLADQRQQDRMEVLVRDTGQRFRDCYLKNYEIYDPKQTPIVEQLKRLQDRVLEHIKDGGGLFLYGPCGTGKDHLAISLLRAAAWFGVRARFVNGLQLFDEVADAWRNDGSERDVVAPYVAANVLLISDPVLPSGLTESNQRTLYRLVSARYDRGLATWCTLNVGGSKAATELLGQQIYDRLLDNAVRLHCAWPSYRERRKPQN